MRIISLLLAITIVFGCRKENTKILPSATKLINTFVFLKGDNPNLPQDVAGRISHDSIIVEISAGTNISNLIPSIAFSGSTLQPESKFPQDFTHTINYTVKAADGSSQAYKVVVKFLSVKKAITSFIFKKADNPSLDADVAGFISGDTIDIATPPGIDLAHLVPTVAYQGKSLSPAGGLTNDFSNPVEYSVTAEDHSTRKYIVYAGSGSYLFTLREDGTFYAINARNGAIRWQHSIGGFNQTSPAYDNGIVFIEGDGHVVYAFDAETGNIKWTHTLSQLPFQLTMPIARNGKVYFGGGNYYMYNNNIKFGVFVLALNQQTGNEDWVGYIFPNYAYVETGVTNITVGGNSVFLYDMINGMYAFDAGTGAPQWGNSGDVLGHGSPAFGNGSLFYDVEGGIKAVDPMSGQQQWLVHNNLVYSSPALGTDAIYASQGNQVQAFDLNGGSKWTASYGDMNSQFYAPAVQNNFVVALSNQHKLVSFSAADGSVKWVKDNFLYNPVASDGFLYLCDDVGHLNCLDLSTGNLKWKIDQGGFGNPYCIVDSRGHASYPTDSGGQN